ncbi:MAG: hypothetical protein V4718_00665 [Pseudomonadota bacterium]
MNATQLSTLSACLLVTQFATAEPLKDFEKVVDACRAIYKERGYLQIEKIATGSDWVKRVYARPTLTYDVQKTNSLVSPFAGILSVTDVVAILRAPDEASAQDLNPQLGGRETSTSTSTLNFAYQSGKWVFTDGTRVSKSNIPGDTGTKVTINPSRQTGPLARCIAGN